MASALMLEDKDWYNLLREIKARKVVPVIGPALVTVTDHGQPIMLNRHLAPGLAKALQLENPEQFGSLNEVARAHLLRGGKRDAVYQELRYLFDGLKATPPSPALMDLAAITDFELFVSSTPDPLLARALEQSRPGFRVDRNLLAFHPNEPQDLPDVLPGSLLYYILGNYNTYPDFAVWEEDYMEFICGLEEARDNLKNLFRTLKNRFLLLLGSPSEDWIVRFFLRVARQQRLSDRHQRDYLADVLADLGEPMIFFFDRVIGATRIIPGEPGIFVQELARRWRQGPSSPADSAEELLRRMPEEMPPGAVFISYSSEDLAAASALAYGLATAGVPVWLDKQRLRVGDNFERSLEHAVKDGCSFFISLISAATEADASRYFHKERAWAANRQVDGFVFYLPVIIDDTAAPKLEPACFGKIHREHLKGGKISREFAQRVLRLVEEYRQSGRPRG